MHTLKKPKSSFAKNRNRPQKPVYLICYDIRDVKRLKRIHYYISKRATAMQYSLFVVFDKQAANNLFRSVSDMIAPEDDLRMYTLPGKQSLWQYGKRLTGSAGQQPQPSGLLSWFTSLLSGD